MRILHTSDWHLGASEENHSLRDDQIFFIEKICEIIKEENIDAVIIAGDIYDRSVASSEAMKLYDMAMEKMCKDLNTDVIVVAGNHDGADRLENCNALLEKAGLFIQGALEKEPKVISYDDTEIFLMPWFTEEKVKTLFPDERENIKSLTDAYQLVLNKARAIFTEGKRHIAVSHAFLTNSETSKSDRAAVIGFAMQVPASVFEGFDYVALGHIHKPQNVKMVVADGDEKSNANENTKIVARYCGTPMQYSFGAEESQEKSVTIIDTKDMDVKIVPIPLLHKRTTIKGTLDEVLNYDCLDEIKNGYVRVEVTDQYLGLEATSQLAEKYPNMLNWSGKMFENENASIHMTMDEFRELESSPTAIFKSFCMEVVGEEPGERLESLFAECVGGNE